jgi:hypothetical protein
MIVKPDLPDQLFKVMIEDANRPLSPEEEKATREFVLRRCSLKDFLEARLRQTKQGRARPCDIRIRRSLRPVS